MRRFVCGVSLGFLPFLAAILERVLVSPRKRESRMRERAHQWPFFLSPQAQKNRRGKEEDDVFVNQVAS